MSGNPTLTEAGQKLADALDVIQHVTDIPKHKLEDAQFLRGVVFVARDYARAASQELTAALLFTAPEREGAGLREALKDALDEYDRNICPHEDTHRGGFIWTICDQCGCKWADDEGGFKPYVDPPKIAAARQILCDAPALASPQPAAEGPVAAGVAWQPIEMAPKDGTWVLGYQSEPASYGGKPANVVRWRFDGWTSWAEEDRRDISHWMPLPAAPGATLTPPADPKPTVPGNDAGMREAIKLITDEAGRYTCFRSGCPQAPDSSTLTVHVPLGLARRLDASLPRAAALAPQTGSAGEDPKTPDAGVGEACSWAGGNDTCYCRACGEEYRYGREDQPACPRLAQPAPVGEDETGVREAINDAINCLESQEERDGPWAKDTFGSLTLAKLRAALTPQPPKAEAPDLDAISAEYERQYAAVPEAARRFASNTWGETWSHAEMGSLLDFAALSAAPAARPGDGVERACQAVEDDAHAASERFEAKGMHAEALTARGVSVGAMRCRRAIAELAAAPAADGGRA